MHVSSCSRGSGFPDLLVPGYAVLLSMEWQWCQSVAMLCNTHELLTQLSRSSAHVPRTLAPEDLANQ